MKILQLSDTHFSTAITDPELKDVIESQLSVEQKLDLVIEQEDLSTYDFVVVSGDIVHEGTAEDYEEIQQILEAKFSSLPIYYTLGNHDKKDSFYKGILHEDRQDCYDYSMIFQGVHIIFMDSAKPYSHSGIFEHKQLEWLASTLEENDLPKMIFQHHPIFGGDYFINFTMEDEASVMNILKQHQIIGIFTGHTHSPATNICEGILQYTTYAISFGLEKVQNRSQLFTNSCGYTMIEYMEDGRLTVAPRIITPQYNVYKQTNLQEMDQLNKSYEN